MRKRLSELHPAIYHTRIFQKRLFRKMADRSGRVRFAIERIEHDLAFPCKKHQSLLRRRLGNSDPQLQENKIRNLKIACPMKSGRSWMLFGRQRSQRRSV